MNDHDLATKLLQDHFTATAAPIALVLALLTGCVSANRRDTEFANEYATALRMCVALASKNSKELGTGTVDPDELSYWFHKARFEASRTFWNSQGREWLRRVQTRPIDTLEAVCDAQLLAESEQEHEVQPSYPVRK